jgi:hypothetical protein
MQEESAWEGGGVDKVTKSEGRINLATMLTRVPQWSKLVTSAAGGPESHYPLLLATQDKLQAVAEVGKLREGLHGHKF